MSRGWVRPADERGVLGTRKMVGVSANKKGRKHYYYACSKHLESKECDQVGPTERYDLSPD